MKFFSKGDNKSPEFSGYASLKDIGFCMYLTKETMSPYCFIDSNATPNTSFWSKALPPNAK